jgi:hypothetical protein
MYNTQFGTKTQVPGTKTQIKPCIFTNVGYECHKCMGCLTLILYKIVLGISPIYFYIPINFNVINLTITRRNMSQCLDRRRRKKVGAKAFRQMDSLWV